jgi:3-oxoacyl-[acyl-carrier protein] reductase
MDISASTVLVSGGGKGLGKAIVEALLKKGATVVAVDIDTSALSEINNPEKLATIQADLLNPDFFQNVLPGLFAKYKFNALVNNAGILHNKPLISFGKAGFTKLEDEEWDKVLNLNLKIPVFLSREVAEHMIKSRTKGVIINISSISAGGNIGQSAYSASKAGLESFTKVISKELGSWGIRAACLAPGYMNTDSTHAVMNAEYLANLVKSVPLKRLGKPEEVAEGVCFLIENDFFTGKVLSIDGGLTI